MGASLNVIQRKRVLTTFPVLRLTLGALALWLRSILLPCQALTIVTPPSFIPATNSPLAGVLQVTTDVESRVAVSVDDGVGVWERRFFDYSTTHSIPLYGFKPGRTNSIIVTVFDRNRTSTTADIAPVFITDRTPDTFPNLELIQAEPSAMEPGYTLFEIDAVSADYAAIVDSGGELVWYNTLPAGFDIRQLADGNLFMPWVTNFVEFNLLGQIVGSWDAPVLPIDVHDGVPTEHGTILYLNDAIKSVPNFPSSVTASNSPTSTANVLYQGVVEISVTNASLLNTWSPIDVLDPVRISYLFTMASDGLTNSGWDTEHSNAVLEDPVDDSLIVSMRNQNAVVKISRTTGQLKWILGPHENWGPQWQPYLLTPVGSPFAWQYGQHAPILTPQGTLVLYDDGNYRASPFETQIPNDQNYSRAVEYRIDETTMEVSQVWEYGSTNSGQWFFTPYQGNAEPEPATGNILINFPAVAYVDGGTPSLRYPSATMARFQEVTHDLTPTVVFDLAVTLLDKPASSSKSCSVYRAHRIPDLYAHPAAAIMDLTVDYVDAVAVLQFSGDDARTYTIQSSTNLADWQALGMAVEDELKSGNFYFQDTPTVDSQHRYYRVVTN